MPLTGGGKIFYSSRARVSGYNDIGDIDTNGPGVWLEYRCGSNTHTKIEDVRWVQFLKIQYQKIEQKGRYYQFEEPMRVNILANKGFRFDAITSTKGNSKFYIDGGNFIEKRASIYFHDPAVSPGNGNISTRGSAIYDWATAGGAVMNAIMNPENADYAYARPDPNKSEIGARVVIIFDDYAVDSADKNKILGHAQWHATNVAWINDTPPAGLNTDGLPSTSASGFAFSYVGSLVKQADLASQNSEIPNNFTKLRT